MTPVAGPGSDPTFSISTDNPPTDFTAKYAAAMTADILMKNWIMSMTRTPQSPEWAAKITFSTPTKRRVSQAGRPKRTFAIFTAAMLTVAMITQLKKRPRYTARKPRTTVAALPE